MFQVNDTTFAASASSVDLSEVKQSAQHRWVDVLSAFGIPESCLVNKHGPCPICGGTKPFRFDDKDGRGTFYCNHCGSGDGFTLLKLFNRQTFGETLRAVAEHLGGVTPQRISSIKPTQSISPSKEPDPKVAKSIKYQWNSAIPISPGTPPFIYLTNRLHGWFAEMACRSEVLRWNPAVPYFDGPDNCLGKFPTLFAKVTNPNGDMVALRRIYLDGDGNKAPVPEPKKMTRRLFDGATRGSAVRLFPPEAGQLIVGEGLENTLAAIHLWGTPGWAAGDAGTLGSMVLPPLALVPQVLIICDNDRHKKRTGEIEANKLERRLLSEGREVRKIMPCTAGKDIDELRI